MQAQPGQPAQPVAGFIDTIQRHEVDSLFANQNQLLTLAKDLR